MRFLLEHTWGRQVILYLASSNFGEFVVFTHCFFFLQISLLWPGSEAYLEVLPRSVSNEGARTVSVKCLILAVCDDNGPGSASYFSLVLLASHSLIAAFVGTSLLMAFEAYVTHYSAIVLPACRLLASGQWLEKQEEVDIKPNLVRTSGVKMCALW